MFLLNVSAEKITTGIERDVTCLITHEVIISSSLKPYYIVKND